MLRYNLESPPSDREHGGLQTATKLSSYSIEMSNFMAVSNYRCRLSFHGAKDWTQEKASDI